MQRIHQGDVVQVVSGKEKGKKGQVIKVLREKQRVVVAGLMMLKRHKKASSGQQKGEIVTKEGSIHISNVMPIDSKTGHPTRVRFKEETNRKIRIAKSNTEIASKTEIASRS